MKLLTQDSSLTSHRVCSAYPIPAAELWPTSLPPPLQQPHIFEEAIDIISQARVRVMPLLTTQLGCCRTCGKSMSSPEHSQYKGQCYRPSLFPDVSKEKGLIQCRNEANVKTAAKINHLLFNISVITYQKPHLHTQVGLNETTLECASTRPHRKPQIWFSHIGCVKVSWAAGRNVC